MKKIKFLLVCGLIPLMCACQTQAPTQPVEVVQTVEVKSKPTVKHPLGIIGAVEPIYILPDTNPFQARIDTGAEVSSVDVDEYHIFERDGVKWVSFTIMHNSTGKKQTFERKRHRRISIRRADKNESRPSVMLDVKFGGKIIKAEFTLAQREKFDYQVLVGRNILTGRAIVDTSLKNTLR
ncbi:MAG: ATP-dependent zinc protease [Alphaproteobacteria bacterium]|nr:ATP-dependent zinc protease [Alphaproteobacteria bacterium]